MNEGGECLCDEGVLFVVVDECIWRVTREGKRCVSLDGKHRYPPARCIDKLLRTHQRALFSGPTKGPTNLKSLAKSPGSTAPKSEATRPRARPICCCCGIKVGEVSVCVFVCILGEGREDMCTHKPPPTHNKYTHIYPQHSPVAPPQTDTHFLSPIMTASGRGEKTGGAAVEGLKVRPKKSYVIFVYVLRGGARWASRRSPVCFLCMGMWEESVRESGGIRV